jgi:hypothetical protein
MARQTTTCVKTRSVEAFSLRIMCPRILEIAGALSARPSPFAAPVFDAPFRSHV